MAYAIKYTIPFKNIDGTSYSVNFLFKDYSGSVTTLTGGSSPCVISSQTATDNILDPVRGLEATFQYINDGTVPAESFITEEDEGIQVIVVDNTNSKNKFVGFVAIEDSSEAFMPSPTVVTMRATDNIGLLKDVTFRDTSPDFFKGRLFISAYIKMCLEVTGLSLNLNTYCNVFEIGMLDRDAAGPAADPLDQVRIDSRTFLKEESVYDDCYTVLTKILDAWECQLFQFEGEWHVVRWPELKNFSNIIPGLKYPFDGSTVSAANVPSPITIGPAEAVKLVNASALKTVIRPIKYDKLIFNYEQPYKLIINNDFKDVGALLSTSTVGFIKTNHYEALEFTYNDAPATDIYIVSVSNIITGVESDRYLVLPFKSSFDTYVTPELIEVNKNDRFDVALSFRTNTDISDNIIFRYGFILHGESGVNYSLTNISNNLVWNNIGTGTIANSLSQTVLGSENSADWRPMNTTLGTNNEFVPPFREDGHLEIQIKGFSDTNASQPHEDTFIKDLVFNYYTYLNGVLAVAGQYHKSSQSLIIKKNLEKTIYVDDSPKNNIRGTMFLSNGISKTSTWYTGGGNITANLDFQNTGSVNLISILGQPGTNNYFYEGQEITITGTASNNGTYTVLSRTALTGDNFGIIVDKALVPETDSSAVIKSKQKVPFGFIQKVDLMKINYTYRIRIEGDFKGEAGLLNVFSIQGLPGKYFITGTVKYDYKTNTWSGVLQEVWSSSDIVPALDNTFEYIYKTQQ